MKNILSLASLCLVASIAPLSAATTVFSETFSTSTISNKWATFVGGNSNNYINFGQWAGPTEASITTGALTVNSTNTIRSAGIILSPADFAATGAGSYTLSFDVTAYSGGAAANKGVVTIWTGSGWNSMASLELAMSTASLVAHNGAVSAQVGTANVTGTATQQSITFNYDGTSAVALFFGVNAASYEFPTATYDNILLSKDSPVAIPEPSVSALAAGMVGVMCLLRRRKARVNG